MSASPEAIAEAIALAKANVPLALEGRALASMSCGKTVFLVCMLGGRGLDSHTFLDVALNWQPAILKAEFMAVRTPPSGQWFDLDADAAAQSAQIRASAEELNGFLDAILAKKRLPPGNLALVGFGEGARMALEVGLRRDKAPAAIISFAGAYEGDATLGAAISAKPPVLLIHGDADQLVPYAGVARTKEILKAEGVEVKSLTRKGIGHAADDDAVIVAGDWLAKILVKPVAHDDHDHDHDHDHAH